MEENEGRNMYLCFLADTVNESESGNKALLMVKYFSLYSTGRFIVRE